MVYGTGDKMGNRDRVWVMKDHSKKVFFGGVSGWLNKAGVILNSQATQQVIVC